MLGKLEPRSQVWIQSFLLVAVFFLAPEAQGKECKLVLQKYVSFGAKVSFDIISVWHLHSRCFPRWPEAHRRNTNPGLSSANPQLVCLAQHYVPLPPCSHGNCVLTLCPQPQLQMDFAGRLAAPASLAPTQTNILPHSQCTWGIKL